MTTLQTRLAQADKPSRELLEEVFAECLPVPDYEDTCDGDCPICRYEDQQRRFKHMLDAEAWTSAVEMLVPEGWLWSVGSFARGSECKPAYYRAVLRNWVTDSEGNTTFNRLPEVANHPALALAIACLKARGLA